MLAARTSAPAQAGYDGPTGLGTPNGVAAFGPGSAPPRTTSRSRSARRRATVTAGLGNDRDRLDRDHLGHRRRPSRSARAACRAGATASFSPASVTSGRLVHADDLDLELDAGRARTRVTITGTGTSATHTTSFTLTVNGVPAVAARAAQKIANPGFESGAAALDGDLRRDRAVRAVAASRRTRGTWDAWLDGYGTHAHRHALAVGDDPDRLHELHAVVLAAHRHRPRRRRRAQYDKLTVTLGSTTLATYSNLNKASGYVQRSFNVSGFAGQTVTLTFTGTEDSSLQTSFVIDDTALNVS